MSGQVVKRAIGSNDSALLPESKRRTVLLTEVGVDPRTLYVARALGKAGHKIIVASGDHNQVVKASRYTVMLFKKYYLRGVPKKSGPLWYVY